MMRDKFIPFKDCKNKQNKWITRPDIECRKAKNKAWSKFKKSESAFEKYKKMPRRSQSVIQSAKQNFEQNEQKCKKL